MYKYVVADLDGTLMKDDGSIDYKSIELISRLLLEKKIEKFVIASGRHYRELSEILASITCSLERVIVVCSDGQYIYDAMGNMISIFDAYVAPQQIEKVCLSDNVISVQAVTDKKDYVYFKSLLRRSLYQIKDFVTGIKCNNYIGKKQFQTFSKVEKLIVFCKSENYDLKVDGSVNFVHHLKSGVIEILAVNKLIALKYLEKMALINLEETIYFGDDENDIECFCYIRSNVAMGNAAESIKSIAKSVTRSNNESGVYYALIDALHQGKIR